MPQYFGGEYESKFTDVVVSAIEGRHFFLRTLYDYRKDVIDDFAAFANIHVLASSQSQRLSLNEDPKLVIARHLVDHNSYSKDLEKVGLSDETRKTPILMFVKYLFENTPEYKKLHRDVTKELQKSKKSRYFSQMVEEEVLIRQFPRWTELQKKKSAQDLCNSLKAWSNRWNLTDNWILDFAIDVLRNFKGSQLDRWQKYSQSSDFDEKVLVMLFDNWIFSNESWHEALVGLNSEGSDRQFRIAESLQVSPFHFNHSGINISATWFPTWQKKKIFRDEVTSIFESEIERRKMNGKEIKVGTKSKFANKLKSYLNEQDLIKNEGFTKLPLRKATKEHFLWLLDYQIPPCESFRALAEKYNVDLKTIRREINLIKDLIGLTFREPTAAGRPAGAVTKERAVILFVKKIEGLFKKLFYLSLYFQHFDCDAISRVQFPERDLLF